MDDYFTNFNTLDTNRIKNLLKKYQQGNCTEEERRTIDEWLEGFPEGHRDDEQIEERLQEIRLRIDKKIQLKSGVKLRYWAIAASVFLAVAVTALFTLYHSGKEPVSQLSKNSPISRSIDNGWMVMKTTRGKSYSFKLPDGSAVILNGGSSIRYPVKFEGRERPVYLDEGEAYFSVASDKKRRFTVYTSHFATTALGTAFTVRAYSREHRIAVSLIQGKVKVEDVRKIQAKAGNGTKSTILNPYQQLVCNTETYRIINRTFSDVKVVADWTQGVLSFDNATLEEVVTKIENRFNIGIRTETPNHDWSYTGTFNKDETLQDVLQTICLAEGVTYRKIAKDSIQIN